jgi:hypothetical protein
MVKSSGVYASPRRGCRRQAWQAWAKSFVAGDQDDTLDAMAKNDGGYQSRVSARKKMT